MKQEPAKWTTSLVADHFNVDTSTVRRWVDKGWITPTVTTPGGHFRFDQAAVDAAESRTRSEKPAA